jgi:glycosyltransferase involved in cell wall biosynthesis
MGGTEVRSRPRLLVVPYFYSELLRARDVELATHLAGRYDVHVWRWHSLGHVPGHRVERRIRQLSLALQDLLRPTRVSHGRVKLVDAPFLQPALLTPVVGMERATRIARRFNGRQLAQLAARLEIDRILMSNAWLDLPEATAPVFHDVVDYFDEQKIPAAYLAREKAWYLDLMSRTAGNFAVSIPIVRLLADEYGVCSHYVPNGVDVGLLRTVAPQTVSALRRSLRLEGRWVLGYLGNHGPHAGIDFLLEVFAALRRREPDAALLIVGPYDWWKPRIRIPTGDGVRFTGAIAVKEIAAYFHAADVTVHPCDQSPFRNFAFPFKVIEASAAQKFVVSTDLMTLRELGLPNVKLLPRTVPEWVDVLLTLRNARWEPAWDAVVDRFDWQVLADSMAELMEQSAAGHREQALA